MVSKSYCQTLTRFYVHKATGTEKLSLQIITKFCRKLIICVWNYSKKSASQMPHHNIIFPQIAPRKSHIKELLRA